jgi:hypothetical protein
MHLSQQASFDDAEDGCSDDHNDAVFGSGGGDDGGYLFQRIGA